MNLKEIMTSDVEVIPPDCTLKMASEKMRDLNVGSLPICEGKKLVGMITDRDITVRGTAEGRDASQTAVRDLVNRPVVCAYEDDSVEHAADLMSQNKIRRLPVVNRSEEVVGMIALGDLAVKAGKENLGKETLQDVSEPSKKSA